MKELIKNKKGDVPITILVIGVFAICSLAILTFFVSDFRISNSFVGVEVMDKLNTISEEYLFYSGSIDNISELNGYFNQAYTEGGKETSVRLINENGTKYFELENSYDQFIFSKFKTERVLLFYVKAPVPS